MDGVAVLMTHGSMRSYRDYLPESTTREELESLLAGHAPDLFIVGHTHVPFFMQRGTVCVAGCGSAGKPVEGTADVSYVIVRNNDGLSGEIVRVAYDVERLTRALIENGLPISNSRKGNCLDNACVESFFARLKTECLPPNRFVNRGQAETEVFKYIEVFYNRVRRHSTLNYLSPVDFELTNNQP